MKLEIKNRFSGAVQFVAEIDCGDDAPMSVKIGLAVRWAYKSGADLRDATLHGANLHDADLRGANLRSVDLFGADLRGANLRGADLVGANLHDADLRGANLRGADLRIANLRGAELGRHRLAEGNSFADLGTPGNWLAFTYCTDQGEQRVAIGCRDFTLAEGRNYWRGKEDRREVMAALDYAEAISRVRGWKK